MSKVSITRSKLDNLAVSISTKSGATLPLTLDQMKTAVDNMSGGGSSDFTTATVTITNSTGSSIMQSCINILEIMGEQSMAAELPPIGADDSLTCDMVLFKGTQTIYAPDDVNIAVAGDITEEEGVIVITGDGTITYATR